MLAHATQSAIDIMTQVEQFYNHAFTAVLWLVGIVFTAVVVVLGLFSVIIPLWQFRRAERRLRDDFKAEMARQRQGMERAYNEQAERLKADIERNRADAQGDIHKTTARIFLSLTVVSANNGQWGVAWQFWKGAVQYLILSNDPGKSAMWQDLGVIVNRQGYRPPMLEVARDTEADTAALSAMIRDLERLGHEGARALCDTILAFIVDVKVLREKRGKDANGTSAQERGSGGQPGHDS